MSASPTSAVASTKRPLEDPSSPAGPNDMPDAKRQALDKTIANDSDDKQPEIQPTSNGSHAVAEGEKKDMVETDLPTLPQVDGAEAATKQESLPIPSTATTIDNAALQPPAQLPTQDESQWIHIRSVISSSEAATVIGKGGENVTQIRRLSGAKCTVSDYSRGAVERILTVSGAQDAVAKVRLGPIHTSWK